MLYFDNLDLDNKIKSILKEYHVDFVFQPIISKNDLLVGYEALMRPEGKNILEFIDEMKENGKLHELELLTFFGATYAYQERGYETLLSVNSFPTELLSEDELIEYTNCFKMPREKVIVEILEYGDGKSWTWKSKSAQISYNKGVEVALDDFGTGLNDMVAVDYYRPQMIKLDRSLISDIDKDIAKQKNVKKLTDTMHERMIVVLAEGIETREELDFLKSINVDFYQGYFLGRPT